MRALRAHKRNTGRGPVITATAAGLLAWVGVSAVAEAQWWEPPQRREYRRPAEPQSAQRRDVRPDESSFTRGVKGPMIAVVSLNDQRITLYDAEGRLVRAPVSSGSTGNETPVGLYTIIQKNRDHVSNLYDADMPFMQRITWSGIALHAGALPGYPASHGCVRMPHRFAETIFDLETKGMRVVLVRNDMSPVEFAHPSLFKPQGARVAAAQTPKEKPAEKPEVEGEKPMRLGGGDLPASENASAYDAMKADADAKAAAAEAAARKADAARARAYRLNAESAKDAKFLRGAEYVKANLEGQLKLAEAQLAAAPTPAATERAQIAVDNARKRLDDANARLASILAQPKVEAAEQARQEAAAAEIERRKTAEDSALAQRKLMPISVLVSRKTQRIYVRQGNEPVMDAPVVIRDADKPIGTTLFTAMAHVGSDVRWTALAMYAKGTEPDANAPLNRQSRRFQLRTPEATPTSVEDAKAVLDRIEIPEEARARISEVVAPGSSLIVSDETMHKETGGGTDFIVLMPGEPQGGIQIRAKPRDRYEDDDDDRPRRRRSYNDNPWW